MKKIPTAEEILYSYSDSRRLAVHEALGAMKEYAKLHVNAALKAASEAATMIVYYPEPYQDSNEVGLKRVDAEEMSKGGEYARATIESHSILDAYPLTNIK